MVVHRQAQQTSELAEWLKVAGCLVAVAGSLMIGHSVAGVVYRDDDADYARRRERRRRREEARRRNRKQ